MSNAERFVDPFDVPNGSDAPNGNLEERTLRPPTEVFRDGKGWHGMGGPIEFLIDDLMPLAKDYLFARGMYEPLKRTASIEERASQLLGRDYAGIEFTGPTLKVCHFPRFGMSPY